MKIKRFYLEITNSCNLNCPFCSYEKGQSFMKLNDIKNYLNQIKEFTDYVYLHVLGEPLLHKNINEILSFTDELKLNVQLVTNGILLDSKIIDHPSLRKLSISLHSINNQTYTNYFENIKRILNETHNTYIELRLYDFNNLNNDLKEFKEYLYNTYDVKNTPKLNSYKIKDNIYVYYDDLFKWPNINDPLISEQGKCHGAIDQLAILVNGNVTICCLDPKGYNTIGNLKENALKEILESNKYYEIVKNFKNNKLTFELCKKCSYRLRFDDKHNLKQ